MSNIGPFKGDETLNVVPPKWEAKPIPYDAKKKEITAYFENRLKELNIVKTTKTPTGQIVDWIPRDSQGMIAKPPTESCLETSTAQDRPTLPALGELQHEGVEVGPPGTVPIPRKMLEKLAFTKDLQTYLSKGHTKGEDRELAGGAIHRYASSQQSMTCFGGSGNYSNFSPYTESSDDFSLIQVAMSNNELGYLQTVEAGLQAYYGLTGHWDSRLFVFYTTNGYTVSGDNLGGYNRDVLGWVQVDDKIFPETAFEPYSVPGGAQIQVSIKYQLYAGNWWLNVQGRWIGYYPARLFISNTSTALGDHADGDCGSEPPDWAYEE
jgi:hypothetical protein